jgi:hypothetical protein
MSLRLRRRAAGVALLTSGATAAGSMLVQFGDGTSALFLAGFFSAAALAISRPSVLGQVIGRGLAILPVIPLTYEILHGRVDPTLGVVGGGAALGLLLARPLLHTKEARASFSPVRFRRWFLAAAAMAASGATLYSLVSYEFASRGHLAAAAGTALLATALIGTTVGIVRMRAWGALLGMLSALLALAGALFGLPAMVVMLSAMPGLVIGGAIAASRLLPELAPAPGRARVFVSDASEHEREAHEAPRVRMTATEPEPLADLEPLPAARAQTR